MKQMESIKEIVPFAKELLSQNPTRGMVKVYLAGTVLAFFGIVIGLVETVCKSFSPREPMDEEFAWLMAREHLLQERKIDVELTETPAATEAGAASKSRVTAVQRNTATRLHAS
ncbi:G0/G1 switch protein 2-like [Conger conger]|nr:G0/G1 switch protein 2-like [Conger conger]